MKEHSLEKSFDKIANLVFSDLTYEKKHLVISELNKEYTKAKSRIKQEIHSLLLAEHEHL